MLKKASLLFIGVVASGLAWADTGTVTVIAKYQYPEFVLKYSAYKSGKWLSPSGQITNLNLNQPYPISKIPNGAWLVFSGTYAVLKGNGCDAFPGSILAVPAGKTVVIYPYDGAGDPALKCL
jgi:hypothetical protein